MQKAHCKLDLSDYKVIVTPPIWGSMLTGKIDDEIIKIWVKQAEITGAGINTKQKWWAKFGDLLPPLIDLWIWHHIFAPIFGGNLFEKTANYVIDKNQTNIFQFFKNPWTNGIPGYKWRDDFQKQKKMQQEASEGDSAQYIKYLNDSYQNRKKQLLSALESQTYDLVFWYAKILDSICHASRIKPIHLMKYYLEINTLIGIVKEKYPNAITLIISDHGMIRKEGGYWWHSNYAFFSSSNGELIEKPLQLYNLIKEQKN